MSDRSASARLRGRTPRLDSLVHLLSEIRRVPALAHRSCRQTPGTGISMLQLPDGHSLIPFDEPS